MTERAYNTGPHRPVNGIGNTPSEIEENKRAEEQQAREKEAWDTLCSLDTITLDLRRMADLTMTWWLSIMSERSGHERREIAITDREAEVLSFALGDLWERACAIDDLLGREA